MNLIKVIFLVSLIFGVLSCSGDTEDESQDTVSQTDTSSETEEITADSAPDEEEEVEAPSCGVIEYEEQQEAEYDIIILLSDVLPAVLTKEGGTLTILPEGDDPIVMDFTEDTNCVPAVPPDLPVPVCFFNADLSESDPETLGAIFNTMQYGAGFVVGFRRGVDRSCAYGGFYQIETSDITTDPSDAAPEYTEQMLEFSFSYLGIFDNTFQVAMGPEPSMINTSFNAEEESFSFVHFMEFDKDGITHELSIQISNGHADREQGEITFDFTMEIESSFEPPTTTTISGSATGVRR